MLKKGFLAMLGHQVLLIRYWSVSTVYLIFAMRLGIYGVACVARAVLGIGTLSWALNRGRIRTLVRDTVQKEGNEKYSPCWIIFF